MPRLTSEQFIAAAEFRSALRNFQRTAERAARRAGLTPQRHLLLLMIRGAPDGSGSATLTELTGRLALAQSTVTELVSRAEDAGLVERRTSREDARVVHLRVTRDGEHRLTQIVEELKTERDDLRATIERLGQTSRSRPNASR